MDKRKASISKFFEEIKNKKLYCYGAGKVFEDFIKSYSDIKVEAVIDKKLNMTYIDVSNQTIKVISVEDFMKESDDSVLLITCLDFYEVEKELEIYTELEKLPYYVYCQMNVKKDYENIQSTAKCQITEFRMQDYNAGHKAPLDVATIAANNGYKILQIVRGTVRYGQSQTEEEWFKAYNKIEENSVILVQFPMVDISGGLYRLNNLKEKKNAKVVCVVHDIEILRRNAETRFVEQYSMLKTCVDVWIVHNNKMKEFLVKEGFPRERMISLDIFDYLVDNSFEVKKDDGIIIAGNLDINKSEYIYHLNEIEGVKFNLFGANYTQSRKYKNINYFGTFLPDDLIGNLRGKYGLVWDGDSLKTCSGLTGEYLRINNPHKLSMYLAVGIPVIIWEEAAEAEFVRNNRVGITVTSLHELSDKLAAVSEKEYESMKKNAFSIGESLRNGEYMTKAISAAENKIKEMETKDEI